MARSVEKQRPTGCEFNILKTVGNGFLKCFKRLAHSADYKTKSKPRPSSPLPHNALASINVKSGGGSEARLKICTTFCRVIHLHRNTIFLTAFEAGEEQ